MVAQGYALFRSDEMYESIFSDSRECGVSLDLPHTDGSLKS